MTPTPTYTVTSSPLPYSSVSQEEGLFEDDDSFDELVVTNDANTANSDVLGRVTALPSASHISDAR